MRDQQRKLVAQDGYWIFVDTVNGIPKVTTTGIPSTTLRKAAIAELKARK